MPINTTYVVFYRFEIHKAKLKQERRTILFKNTTFVVINKEKNMVSTSSISIDTTKQIAWVGDSVLGHSIDPISGKIDSTEGFGAFDSIFKTSHAFSGRAIDIGGGSSDANCTYIAHRYLLDSVVYDPFMRAADHNERVLKLALARPYKTVFSLSVLNVISNLQVRREHIKLCHFVLKQGGKAVFKVWPGDKSGAGRETASGYQSNRDMESYLDEMRSVFGRDMVRYDPIEKVAICFKKIDFYPSGSACL